MSESIVLCEGFDDRAFWKGWLTYLRCTDLGAQREGEPAGPRVRDPWGEKVEGGDFGFRSRSGQFIRVRPCQGRLGVRRAARIRLEDRTRKALRSLVVNVDTDTAATGTDRATGLRNQDVLSLVQEFDASSREAENGEILMDGGATCVSLVRWETDDEPRVGVPSQQTLERLVIAAIVAAYPERGASVQAWLQSRLEAPVASGKEYAWSHMAGWYADSGCERFYSGLWEDASVAKQLEDRLRRSGAWRVAEALAE